MFSKVQVKKGGNVDVSVKNKVLWPHEAILGGFNRQRVTYDQLSLTQWVQGFCKNILEEKSSHRRDTMVSYLGDLMEDATDFTWQGAKAAHAVLMCEMERGLSSGRTRIESTGFVGPMPRNMLQPGAGGLSHRIRLRNHGFAKISNQAIAPTVMIMSLMGNCKSTYVLFV